MLTRINAWLNAHPYAKGALTIAEGAAFGAFMDALANPLSFTRAGWHQTAITVVGAVVVALRNYFKQAPRTEWTPAKRAAEAITNPPAPQDPSSAQSTGAVAGGRP